MLLLHALLYVRRRGVDNSLIIVSRMGEYIDTAASRLFETRLFEIDETMYHKYSGPQSSAYPLR